MEGSRQYLDLDAATTALRSQGDIERDPKAAQRVVTLAEGYLKQLEGAPVALAARARFRVFLAWGLLAQEINGANSPSFFLDIQYAIGQLNKAILELGGSGERSFRAAAHTTLARAYFLGTGVGPIHLYEPLAIQHGEIALRLAEEEANSPLWVEAVRAISVIYCGGFTGSRGDHIERAIELLEEASRRLSDEIGSEYWCEVMCNLGEAFASRPRGDQEINLARAIECLEAVAAIENERRPKGWAKAQVSIGGVWGRRGDSKKALYHFERAQLVFESVGEYNNGDLLRLYRTMASIYGEMGDEVAQIDFLRRSLDRCGPLDRDLDRIRTQSILANALRKTDATQADQLLRECLNLLKEHPAAIRDRVYTMWSLAHLRIDEWRNSNLEALLEATKLLREAKELAWDDPRLAWAACNRLARAYGLADRWPEAANAYAEAIDRLELNYRAMTLLRSRGEDLAENVEIWHDAAYAMVRAGRELDAVAILWSTRARLLREILRRDHVELERIATDHPSAYKAYVEAAERVRAVEALDRASRNDDFFLRNLAEEAQSANEALNDAIELIRAIPRYVDFLSAPEVIYSPAGYMLVFLVTTSNGSLIITAQKHGDNVPAATAYRIDSITIAEVMTALGLSEQVSAEKLGADCLCKAIDRLGPAFADVLADAIPVSVRNVTLVPCGLLGVLPFHMAWMRRDGWQRRLIDECVVDYALIEASSSEHTLARPVEPVVAIGDPTSDLAAADDELEAVRIAHPGVTIVTGADATVTAVEAIIERAGVVHFACHSNLNPTALYESGLHLSQGTLTIGKLLAGYPPKLRAARLVVLSSCESAVVDPGRPDQAMGLPAAFFYAGAGAVIASLWPVSDAAAAVLMGDFYSRLQITDGRIASGEPARALRESQRWLRSVTAGELLKLRYVRSQGLREVLRSFEAEEAPFASAQHWAAFVVQGA